MNLKTKVNICRRVIDEVSKEYEGAREFISNKINELCSEHGISTEELRLYPCYATCSLAMYTV